MTWSQTVCKVGLVGEKLQALIKTAVKLHLTAILKAADDHKLSYMHFFDRKKQVLSHHKYTGDVG